MLIKDNAAGVECKCVQVFVCFRRTADSSVQVFPPYGGFMCLCDADLFAVRVQ